ncbi:hypothetical protein EJ110_NYTH23488 [Nymphaea thermarum]|nr:hypothetical protein EJ110_NYTH23488 [Nymphaea thermarum]
MGDTLETFGVKMKLSDGKPLSNPGPYKQLIGALTYVTIRNGNKSGLFSVLIRDYNAHAAASCMNRLAKLSARWIGNHGFTIGIDDVQPEVRLAKKNSRVIRLAQNHCNSYIDDYNKGVLQPQPGSTAAETLEAMITSELSGIREKVGELSRALVSGIGPGLGPEHKFRTWGDPDNRAAPARCPGQVR